MTRTRIAPSPTGYPHIGTIYQSLFDYAYAKRHHGKFIIRIEDTDRERFVSNAEEKLYQAIDWFGLVEDESPRREGEYKPYVQSQRLALYKEHAEKLIEKGHVYYCFCTKERLDEVRKQQQIEKKPLMYDKHCRNLSRIDVEQELQQKKPYVIRLKVPENEKITVVDEIRGEITFETNLIDDQVLMKSDGFPTYHLASVVDDHLMLISHVVRGEEWLPSYPKHILLYRFFSWKHPLFFHTSALRNPDHSKLSKRQGHTNVTWYQEEGYLPEAILNYITLLGWSHPEEKEIFSLEEFIQLFDLKDLKPIGPIFDVEKLNWMNGEYIRQMTNTALLDALVKFFTLTNDTEMLTYLKNNDEKFIDAVMSLVKTRIKTLKDITNLALPLQASHSQSVSISYTEQEKEIAKGLQEEFGKIENWDKENILTVMKTVLKQYSIKGNILYKILTGQEKGLPLPESLELIGKDKTIESLGRVILATIVSPGSQS
ncbi:MAG TPA: glutamate--tRNA ligase [Candidatus Saccharimonadales bacterium]|nr:glutamate--tRNA ligase [Candidatus Saccharimonadales bacterium]